jgi:hypothetical protein
VATKPLNRRPVFGTHTQVAWFGTDGAALIAELVIFLPTAYDFYKSVDEAVDCCK